ncbi:MAG: phage holin family protein [Actinomycetaceae bacterium]|nr:phage holin family protein [Actinomycetaceae bacterium]
MRFVIRLLGTMLGIWLSTLFIPGISIPVDTSFTTTLLTLAGIALVLTLVNGIVRPIIGVLAFPLYLVTFGLFALVTNAIVFMLAGWASTVIGIPFATGGFIPSLLGGTLTAIVSAIVVAVLGKDKSRDD